MKKYLTTLLVVMGIIGGGLSIGWWLADLCKFLIVDKGIEIWIVFLVYVFILSLIITTTDYFSTKEDKRNEE